MTTPHVTELPLRLEPVTPDPFIAAPSPPPAVARRSARLERERRLDLVRRVMARNGRAARRTVRP
jgi:hypothetical protein